MQDFATHGTASPKVAKFSPQVIFFWRKILVSATAIVACFLASFAVVFLFLLQSSTFKRDAPIGIAILSGSKDQINKALTIVWLDPITKTGKILHFPPEILVHTTGGKGYSLRSLYGLSILAGQTPHEFLVQLARNTRIDARYLMINAKPITEFNLRSILWSEKTNMTLADRVSIAFAVWGQHMQMEDLTLPQSSVHSELGFDDPTYEKFLAKTIINPSLKNESLTLAIVNSSGQTKLASSVGRILTGLGVDILSLNDRAQILENAELVVKDSSILHSNTVELLNWLFGTKAVVKKEVTNEYRADMVIYLGKKEAINFTP